MATVHTHSYITPYVTHGAPPSPTFTNPDLILPWQTDQANNSSPAPIASSPTLHSEPSLTRLTHPRSHSSESRSSEQPQAEVGVAKAVMMPPSSKPGPPTTIYQTYEHGSALSDIHEEDTPKSKRTRSRTPSPGQSQSPTRLSTGLALRHKNRLSTASDMSTGSDIGDWESFDPSKMMNARLAADVAKADDNIIPESDGLDNKRNSIIHDDEMVALNQKAENILANAKKRLTHMQDNLSIARSSIFTSPRTSPVIGEHQPVGGLYRSISQGGERKMGQGYMRRSRPLFPILRTVPNGHVRGSSDNSATLNISKRSPQVMRSASALELNRSPGTLLGHSPSSSRSFNSPMRTLDEEYVDGSPSTTFTSPYSPASASGPRGLGISNSSPTNDAGNGFSTTPTTHHRASSQASNQSARELRDQMNGLKVRIADLQQRARSESIQRQHGQTMRTPSPFTHKSEQWYAAAPEYQETSTPVINQAGFGGNPVTRVNELPDSPASLKDSAFGDGGCAEGATPVTIRTDVNTPSLARRTVDKFSARALRPVGPPFPPMSQYEDAEEELDDQSDVATSEEEQIYLNEALEESLQTGDSDIPIMLDEDFVEQVGAEAERHEDRVDAFDYQNMFLHSALGNYSQAQREEEDSDTESEDSVETRRAVTRSPGEEEDDDTGEPQIYATRGDFVDQEAVSLNAEIDPSTPRASVAESVRAPKPPWMKASRSNSIASVATTATFATATEGYNEAAEDDRPSAILNWGNEGPRLPERNYDGWPTPSVGISGASSPTSPRKGQKLQSNGGGNMSSRRPMHDFRSPTVQQQFISAGPVRPPQSTHQPANTEMLMASLIILADSSFEMPEQGSMFADVDKSLVVGLLRAVGGVCRHTISANEGPQGEAERMMWRARLEAAREVLERGL